MKIFLLPLLFAIASADKHCKGINLDQKYYNVEIIREGINRVHELVFNRNENTAYFTFEQIAKVPTRVLGYLKLADGSAGLIGGIRNATGLAIDQGLNRLYVGGSDGLFMINLNQNNKVPERLPVNDDIRSLFVKDNVVYFVNKLRSAYKFEYGGVSPVYELQGFGVDKLILDDDSNIMFLQNNKIFRAKIGTRIVNSHEKVFATDIAVDTNYKPYVCAVDGLYVYNKYKYVLDKVGDLQDIKKLAFVSKDEPIYIVVDNLVRLIKSPIACFED